MIVVGIFVASACLYLLWQWWARDLVDKEDRDDKE